MERDVRYYVLIVGFFIPKIDLVITEEQQLSTGYSQSNSWRTSPLDIDIKLLNGRSHNEGLIIIRPRDGIWGSVCDDGWDDADATVACRMLGFQSGLAKFPPLFGSLPAASPIYLRDLSCTGAERSLLNCSSRVSWGQTNCQHSNDAGVLCLSNLFDSITRTYGYPAIPRANIDNTRAAVILPFPHLGIPWSDGDITSWNVYLRTSGWYSVQVWRPESNSRSYQLLYITSFEATRGPHTIEVLIPVKAGDTIGIGWGDSNPVPFDVAPGRCEIMTMVADAKQELVAGQRYTFTRDYGLCKMYSVYTQYNADEYTVQNPPTYTFNLTHGIYSVVLSSSTTYSSAEQACTQSNGSLVYFTSAIHLIDLGAALRTIPLLRHSPLWVAGGDLSLENDWGHCHPVEGRNCVVLQLSGDVLNVVAERYLMFSRNCLDTSDGYICEFKVNNTQSIDETSQAPQDPVIDNIHLSIGTILILIVVPVVLFTICSAVVVSFIKQKQRQRKKRAIENMKARDGVHVGFVDVQCNEQEI